MPFLKHGVIIRTQIFKYLMTNISAQTVRGFSDFSWPGGSEYFKFDRFEIYRLFGERNTQLIRVFVARRRRRACIVSNVTTISNSMPYSEAMTPFLGDKTYATLSGFFWNPLPENRAVVIYHLKNGVYGLEVGLENVLDVFATELKKYFAGSLPW